MCSFNREHRIVDTACQRSAVFVFPLPADFIGPGISLRIRIRIHLTTPGIAYRERHPAVLLHRVLDSSVGCKGVGIIKQITFCLRLHCYRDTTGRQGVYSIPFQAEILRSLAIDTLSIHLNGLIVVIQVSPV